jgi:hypothetical protein
MNGFDHFFTNIYYSNYLRPKLSRNYFFFFTMTQDKDKKSGRLENSGRSEEELLSEQLRLLAEAKERFRTQQQ